LGLLVLLQLLFVGRVFAQQRAIEFDPVRTVIHFTLKTSLHTVHGTFRLKSGTVMFDPAAGKAAGLIVVDAASGESGNTGRDSKMHGEILESRKYPEIIFTSEQVQGDVQSPGESQLRVKGKFRLHGQDHDLMIPIIVHIAGSDLALDANFDVPYIAWGLKNPGTFILRASDTVQVNVHGVAQWITNPAN
jgi:polyisoprenoid-binding protein YceI